MSRSYKKPYITDQNHGHPKHGRDKRIAARAVRQAALEAVANGAGFRRVSNSWDIRDWSFRVPADWKGRRK